MGVENCLKRRDIIEKHVKIKDMSLLQDMGHFQRESILREENRIREKRS